MIKKIIVPQDILQLRSDDEGRISFMVNTEIEIVMSEMTTSLVAREMLETIKQLQKKPRQTKRPK